jgi:hypothetical membrane protein
MRATTYFLLVIIAMHVLSPDIDRVNRPTSEYATGPFGYLMTSAFLALSLATWCLVVGVHRSARPHGAERIGLVFLAWFGTALLIAAAFPIDVEGAPGTFHGTVHRINGPLAFLSLTLGTNFTSRLFRMREDWRSIHRVASTLALLMIPEFIAGGVTAARNVGAGIAQRIMIATFAAWFLVVASRLRKSA